MHARAGPLYRSRLWAKPPHPGGRATGRRFCLSLRVACPPPLPSAPGIPSTVEPVACPFHRPRHGGLADYAHGENGRIGCGRVGSLPH